MQQILTKQQTGHWDVFKVSGDVYVRTDGGAWEYFNIRDVVVPGFVPGATRQTHASYILMAICGGFL